MKIVSFSFQISIMSSENVTGEELAESATSSTALCVDDPEQPLQAQVHLHHNDDSSLDSSSNCCSPSPFLSSLSSNLTLSSGEDDIRRLLNEVSPESKPSLRPRARTSFFITLSAPPPPTMMMMTISCTQGRKERTVLRIFVSIYKRADYPDRSIVKRKSNQILTKHAL